MTTEAVTGEVVSANALALATKDLEPESQLAIRGVFDKMFTDVEGWIAKAKTVRVTDESQKREMKLAGEYRKAIKEVRVNAEKARKRLKADSLLRGKAIDGAYNILAALVEPIEADLAEQETFAERAQAARRDALRSSREETLRALGTDPSVYANLGEAADEAWAKIRDDAQAAHDARAAAAAKAEADRVEAARAAEEAREAARIAREAAEAERKRLAEEQRAENERLKREAAEREAAAKVERERMEAEAKAAREVAEKKLAAEREAARIEKERIEAAARTERAEAARVQAERDAAAKAERDAAEKKAREEREAQERKWVAERAEAARVQAERDAAAKAERENAEAVAKAAREEAAKVQAALDAEREEVRAAEAARVAEERRQHELAEAKRAQDEADRRAAAEVAALAPDREKLLAYAAAIKAIPLPTLTTEKGRELAVTLEGQRDKMVAWIGKSARSLGEDTGTTKAA